METAELFLIYGRTKEVLIGTLSRKSELKRLRIKRSQIKKWAENEDRTQLSHLGQSVVMGRELISQEKIFSLSVECCLDSASLKKQCKFELFSSLYM